MNFSKNGSSWNKWDLHFHTPSSYDYGDKSITDEDIINELVNSEIKVIAITDHHLIDVQRIQNLQSIGKDKITILPGIEFLSDARGKEPIHFIGIFSEDCNIEHIWEQLKNKTNISKIYSDNKKENEVYCHLLETIKLVKELGGIVTIHAGAKSNGIENITHSLPHSLAQKEDTAKAIHVFELGKESDLKGYETAVLPYLKKTINKDFPLIICSDNHNIKKYVIKQNLWIKAIPSFEGLKQIIYEPNTRVKISKNKPISPARAIQSIKLQFPKDTKIVHKDPFAKKKYGRENKFCFFENEIHFSPYFTCLIGGRGSGKSTILNLIAEKIIGNSDFFQENKLRHNSQEINPSDYIEIESTTNEIEFISQNQIESFAGSGELTDAVYDRIKHYSDYLYFTDLEDKTIEYKNLIDEQIRAINEKFDKENQLLSVGKILENDKKIIQSQKDDNYKKITEDIKRVSEEIKSINVSQDNYIGLSTSLKNLIVEYKIETPKNQYDLEIEKITTSISNLIPEKEQIEAVEKKLEELIKERRDHKVKLDNYLQKMGVSEEQINDYERAASNISENNHIIRELKKDIDKLSNQIREFFPKENDIIAIKTSIEAEIENALKPLNDGLKSKNKNVSDIRFEYEFDEDSARRKLFDEFMNFFSQYIPSEYNTRRNAIFDYLFCIHPINVDNYDIYMDTLYKFGPSTNAQNFIETIFENKVHFETYKLLIKKSYFDVPIHKKIIGFYDNKELQNCSFGQRCTAVIVALIMFGNKPLLIDEPEAHLDSKLIAQYLVDLIKEKKNNRQIIFATHNANFVVNGDSELIQVLEVDKNNKTQTVPITIENTKHRELLLALEGGKEAFELRNKKIIK